MASAPWLATAELGKQIAAKAAEDVEKKVKDILTLNVL
jgi:creatinine amidohydrolase/Fe(II)-dependent formamide hydrolase-like protein